MAIEFYVSSLTAIILSVAVLLVDAVSFDTEWSV